ncbi:MAG: hypothetical protein ACFCUM_11525 [Bacteroidales bacterium]
MRPSLLITGSHRSGKSCTVKGLNIKNHFNLIHEPLNKSGIGWIGLDNLYYYTYIDKSNSHLFKKEFDRTIYKYNYRAAKQLSRSIGLSNISKIVKDVIRSLRYKFNNKPALLDDPFAVFSAEWFYKEYNSDVIIMIRHPASFVSSLKLLNYRFDFYNILNQKHLVENKLKKYLPELIEFTTKEKSIVEQGEFLWRMIYDVVGRYRDTYKSKWLFVRFEDVVRYPDDSFEKILNYAGISPDKRDIGKIKIQLFRNTEGNDKEARILGKNGNGYSVHDHLKSFKTILTSGEIDYIKLKSQVVWKQFYTDEDW